MALRGDPRTTLEAREYIPCFVTVVFEFSLTSHSLDLIPGKYILHMLILFRVTALLVGQNDGGNDYTSSQEVL
jgi:hypothetical protein